MKGGEKSASRVPAGAWVSTQDLPSAIRESTAACHRSCSDDHAFWCLWIGYMVIGQHTLQHVLEIVSVRILRFYAVRVKGAFDH